MVAAWVQANEFVVWSVCANPVDFPGSRIGYGCYVKILPVQQARSRAASQPSRTCTPFYGISCVSKRPETTSGLAGVALF
jgi:hypothetical protein